MEVGAPALPKWGFPRITAILVVGGLYWSPRMSGNYCTCGLNSRTEV